MSDRPDSVHAQMHWSDPELELVEAHRVFDQPIVPAAVLIGQLLSHLRCGNDAACLNDLLFHAPIPSGGRAWLTGRPVDAKVMQYSVFRISEDGADEMVMEGSGRMLESTRHGDAPTARGLAPGQHEQVLGSEEFYETLHRSGNSFLHPLRLVSSVSLKDDSLHVSIDAQSASFPAALDACLHSLLAFHDRSARDAHVIRSIDRVEVLLRMSGNLRGRGWLRSRFEHGFIADLSVTDAAGELVAEFRGVHYTAYVPPRPTLVLAGNFSLEPFKEAYDRLARVLGLSARLAPFDQIHQTLLDPDSPALETTTAELLLVVDLSRWDEAAAIRHGEQYRRALAAGGRATSLPNKLEVLEVNKYETDYLYEEIFDRRSYLMGGMALAPHDTVLDIGANIGLFSLHVLEMRPDARILAFEPSPITAEIARANLDGRGDATVFQVGVSDAPGAALFTHYDSSTVFSGFHVDELEDRRAIEQVIDNRLAKTLEAPDRAEYVTDLAANRLSGHQLEVRTTCVSAIIDEHSLSAIGLLKIDAEKSEHAILRGIRSEHWPRIRQVALEIHDPGMVRIGPIKRFMEEQGYIVSVFEDAELRKVGLYSMSAVRTVHKRMPSIGGTFRRLHERLDELREAIQSFRRRSPVPVTVVFTSSDPAGVISTHVTRQYRQAVRAFRRGAKSITHLSVATQRDIDRRYPITAANRMFSGVEDAGVPFGMDWYAAASLWALRRHTAATADGKKVLVVDCDNTLWRGLCAEDGPLGVDVSAPFRRWQKFLTAQARAGAILCLCSRNVPGDVLAVFGRHPDMELALEDIALVKVDWKPKSELLGEIVEELDVASDSVVLVDDNAAECAEVRLAHPDVVCLRFPASTDDIDRFCRDTWIFDLFRCDGVALDRASLYRQEWRRKAFRKSQYSLEDFIKGLALEVELERIEAKHIDRIGELAHRTNQFNLNGRIRNPAEVAALLSNPAVSGWVVAVRDRFGDYGVTGAIYGERRGGVFHVENILLSCRVLGRGVEQCVAARLADALVSIGADRCRLTAKRTDRNVPATRFFQALAGTRADVETIEINVQELRSIPLDQTETRSHRPGRSPRRTMRAAAGSGRLARMSNDGEWLDWIRRISHSAESVAGAVWAARGPQAGKNVIGETTTERSVATLWREVLGALPATRDSDFFAAGGTSLQLVRLVSAVKQQFSIPLRLSEVYGHSTFFALSELIDSRVRYQEPRDGESPREHCAPALAPTQEGLWFIQNLDSQSTIYNASIALCAHRPLDPDRLDRQLQALLRDHPILASRYSLNGASTDVCIDEAARIPLTTVDGSSWSLQELVEYCSAQARRPIDLRQAPIVKAFLVRWSEDRSVVLLVTHHLIADLKSLELMLSKLLLAGPGEGHCALGQAGFWRFAAWHRRLLDSDNGAALERFWRAEMCDPPPAPLIEYQGRKRAQARSSFAVATSYVGCQRLEQLRQLARGLRSSVFLVLLSATASFAGAFFRKSDFVIGTPVSLRGEGPYSSALGNFVNLLPIRTRRQESRFSAMHDDVRRTFERCLAHKELPFHRLTQLVGRRPDRSPLVQMIFSFHESDGSIPIGEVVHHGHLSQSFLLDDIRCEILGLEQQVGQVDIAVETFACESGLGINLKYATNCLTATAARKFSDGFGELLDELAVERLSWLSAARLIATAEKLS